MALDTCDFAEGYMLVMVPAKLTRQWVQEIQRFLHPDARLPHSQKTFKIIDVRQDASDLKRPLGEFLKECIYAKREGRGLSTIIITSPTGMVDASNEAMRKKKPTRQPCMIVWDEIQDTKLVDGAPARFVKLLVEKASEPVHVLALSGTPMRRDPNDFALVESIATHNLQKTWKETGKATKTLLDNTKESFVDLGKKVLNSQAISKCKKGLALSNWERTDATDLLRRYDRAGRDYAQALGLLERKGRTKYFEFRLPLVQPDEEKAELKSFDSPMHDSQKHIAANFKTMLIKRFTTKAKKLAGTSKGRSGKETTFGVLLFVLEPSNQIRSSDPTFDGSRVDLSLVAFAPGLANNILQRTPMSSQFRTEEANSFFRGAATQLEAVKQSKYWDMALDAFSRVDPGTGERVPYNKKIAHICNIIDAMLLDKDMHKDRGEDLGPLRKKAVICVPYPWHGYILIAYLFKKYPQHNFTYIGSRDTAKQQNELLEPFSRGTSQHDPKEDNPGDPIALISTYWVMAEGLNLQRCNYVIATSPLSETAFEAQLFARVNRIGQKCKTHTYVLVDHGDPTDVTTHHYKQRRNGVTTVPEEEKGSGLEYLLEEDQPSESSDHDDDDEEVGDESVAGEPDTTFEASSVNIDHDFDEEMGG